MRSFDSGERNSCSRYPCAAWISTTSNPASSARRAASANAVTTSRIPATSSASGVAMSPNGIADGATVGQPPSDTGIDPEGCPGNAL